MNVVGLRRCGFSEASIEALNDAFRLIYRSKFSRQQAFQILEERGNLDEHVRYLIDFLRRMVKGKKGRYLEGMRRS